jgi:hypothetical protein
VDGFNLTIASKNDRSSTVFDDVDDCRPEVHIVLVQDVYLFEDHDRLADGSSRWCPMALWKTWINESRQQEEFHHTTETMGLSGRIDCRLSFICGVACRGLRKLLNILLVVPSSF